MACRNSGRFAASFCASLLATALGTPCAVAAQPPPIEGRVEALEAELRAQRALIAAQAGQIRDQQRQLDTLKGLEEPVLDSNRGAGRMAANQPPAQQPAAAQPQQPNQAPAQQASAQQASAQQPSAQASTPPEPVGEAPDLPAIETEVEAVPQGQGVLTPAGQLVFDPSLEYTNSSANRLVFRGIELIPGIQFGVIEASDADRDTLAATATARYGLTNRLEVEVRVPFLLRSDRIEVLQQREGSIVRVIDLDERNIGDIEFAARYQLNRPRGQRPIYVASLRVKSDTGKGPFGIPFDDFGIATGLATGSGFWALQPGINMLLPSDPAVIFGSASYLYHMPRDIDEEVGGVQIGRVDPGDAISGNIGFGFALNPRFSYSLAYRHNYIFPTTSELGQTTQRSSRLHVGALSFGMSYRVTPRQSVNLGFDFGVTEDAPDVSVTLRAPFSLGRF